VIVAGVHTNEIFIENGRFHGRVIAEAIRNALKVPLPAGFDESHEPAGAIASTGVAHE
jgi:hypothetical protein